MGAITSGFASMALALAASLSWGGGDFTGGLAARRQSVFRVLPVSFGAGLLLSIGLALFRGEPFPSPQDLAWSLAAGLSGGVGLAALYRALAVGRMGLAAPISAVLSSALPALVGLGLEGLPAAHRLAGFGLAMPAIWLVTRPQAGERPAWKSGLGLSVLAGFGTGGFLIFIDRVSSGMVFGPLAVAKLTSLLLLLPLALARRRGKQQGRRIMLLALAAGALDMGGNVLFLLAAQTGRLDVSVVLSSFYPVVTVLLARFILAEPIFRAQAAGIAASMAAVLLIVA